MHDPSHQEVFTLIRALLIELFGFAQSQVTWEAHIVDDLDLDSIDAVELIVKIQEQTGQTIDPEAFKQIRTVRDMVDVACASATSSTTAT